MSRVALIKYTGTIGSRGLGAREYGSLLASAFKTLAGGPKWESFVKKLFPQGVVGLKTNCLAMSNPTPKGLVEALGAVLTRAAGIRANDIVVWERTGYELKQAGYTLNASSSGMRCMGTDSLGVGYGDEFFESGKVNTLVSRVVTDVVDHCINVPVLKDHSIAGLSGGLKNMFGAIRNPNKYHTDNCDPYVADVNCLKPIRRKNRLTIIDAVRVQYDKGPGFDPRFIAPYGGIVVSVDPVAADSVGLEIVNGLRKSKGRAALSEEGREVKYLVSAKKAGLGECDVSGIDVRVIAVDADGKESEGKLF